MKIVNINEENCLINSPDERRKPLYFPNEGRNLNEIFRKNVSYDNIKNQNK